MNCINVRNFKKEKKTIMKRKLFCLLKIFDKFEANYLNNQD